MQTKIEFSKIVVEEMIRLYVRKKLHLKEFPPEYEALRMYCLERLDSCRFGDEKPKCSDCKVHCYKPAMREKVKEVMRWAGSRMLFYHPIDTIKYLYFEFK